MFAAALALPSFRDVKYFQMKEYNTWDLLQNEGGVEWLGLGLGQGQAGWGLLVVMLGSGYSHSSVYFDPRFKIFQNKMCFKTLP